MELPRIYCINLRSRPDRRARMERRFAARQITNFQFVEAVTHASSLVDYYTPEFEDKRGRCTTACFASHLEALRTLLKTDREWGIVCEDDVIPHRDFNHLLAELVRDPAFSVPERATTLCMLSYFPTLGGEFPLVRQVGEIALRSMQRCAMWGGQMYLIHRAYAMECLRLYDRPDFGLPRSELRTSEQIPTRSGGLLTVPMLAIEDCIDSDIRDAAGMGSHNVFGRFERMSYGLGEGVHLFTDFVDEGERSLVRPDEQASALHGDRPRDVTVETPLPHHVISWCVGDIVRYRNSDDFAGGLARGEELWRVRDRLWRDGCLESWLSEWYVVAYYADRQRALEIGKYYISCLGDERFRKAYEAHREHIRSNFGFIHELAELLP